MGSAAVPNLLQTEIIDFIVIDWLLKKASFHSSCYSTILQQCILLDLRLKRFVKAGFAYLNFRGSGYKSKKFFHSVFS